MCNLTPHVCVWVGNKENPSDHCRPMAKLTVMELVGDRAAAVSPICDLSAPYVTALLWWATNGRGSTMTLIFPKYQTLISCKQPMWFTRCVIAPHQVSTQSQLYRFWLHSCLEHSGFSVVHLYLWQLLKLFLPDNITVHVLQMIPCLRLNICPVILYILPHFCRRFYYLGWRIWWNVLVVQPGETEIFQWH